VELKGDQIDTDIDLGAITLTNGKKSFIFDVIQSYREYNDIDNTTTIDIRVEIDKEMFKEQSKFDLTDMDLLKIDTKGEIYFAMDDMDLFNWAKIWLNIKFTPKTINLKLETE
jgi:hypothetical protein